MDKQEFIEYIEEGYDISGEEKRLIVNILSFVETLPEEDHYTTLTALLDGTFGLSDAEIRKIYL